MIRTKTILSALLLTAILATAGPALADERTDKEPAPCVTVTLFPPDVDVDVECIKDLIPPPPPPPSPHRTM